MGKHFGEQLSDSWPVMSSDDDQPVFMEINVGFTPKRELAVAVDYTNYENEADNCSTIAIVDTDDARRMAKNNDVKFEELPRFISECMDEWDQIINASLREVRECFKEITDALVEEGCRFRIERSYGEDEL